MFRSCAALGAIALATYFISSVAAMAEPAGVGLFCMSLRSVPWRARLEPTAPYRVYRVNSDLLNERYCNAVAGQTAVGCTYSLDGGKTFIIVVADNLRADDTQCVIDYEKSHLPPNCWVDEAFENPKALKHWQSACPQMGG